MRRAVIGLIILFALISFFGIGKASEENYCTDKESWQEWDELITKNPNDQDIHILHALRIGLCAKVERGEVMKKTFFNFLIISFLLIRRGGNGILRKRKNLFLFALIDLLSEYKNHLNSLKKYIFYNISHFVGDKIIR